MLNNLA